MSNLNNLISKIIEDANINAAQILKDAEVEKNNIIEKITIEATAKTEDIIRNSNLEAKNIIKILTKELFLVIIQIS